MEKSNIKQNSVKAWVLASRPKTLAAAAVPVMVATAMSWKDCAIMLAKDANSGVCHLNVFAAVLCFLFAFIMQIDANFVNDYFDCVRGNDDETRLGPKRACAQGWISLGAMRIALITTTIIGCAVGLPLAFIGGWEMVIVGVACVVFCFLYTTCLSYLALGDVLVLVFFGLVPTCCTYYVGTGTTPGLHVWIIAFAVGFVIDNLLIVNNYRDIENDRMAGKRTLAVILGPRVMEWLYLLTVFVALVMLLLAVMIICPKENVWTFAATPFLLIHFDTWRKMVRIGKGKELNKVLGDTARNILLFGILSTLVVIFA